MTEKKNKILANKIPKHVAIIMDGNGRWAKSKGNQRIFGHQHGVKAVRDVTEAAAELKIKYLTLYAFSKENWNRPKTEVKGLMSLLVKTMQSELNTLLKNNVKLHIIGDMASLPEKVRKGLEESIKKTEGNTGLNLIIALSYGARWEITNAINHIIADVKSGRINNDITETDFATYLTTKNIPDPELMIRTGGEQRISNFLLWQISYAELYFTEVLWPDFRKNDFFDAILDFQNRERRFGKTSEQTKSKKNDSK
jgi:undecaprenyl diphosphate synthase